MHSQCDVSASWATQLAGAERKRRPSPGEPSREPKKLHSMLGIELSFGERSRGLYLGELTSAGTRVGVPHLEGGAPLGAASCAPYKQKTVLSFNN